MTKKYFNNFYISCKANDYIIYLTVDISAAAN